ncbi:MULTISPECIES: hypothetical protein [unclassified Streptomyces]|nr:hypothetical protein [Streptomyces sp. NBC_01445]WSE03924.1 hypothetical protein OG574_11445 [Streptomyces sp. NBC_01445]
MRVVVTRHRSGRTALNPAEVPHNAPVGNGENTVALVAMAFN